MTLGVLASSALVACTTYPYGLVLPCEYKQWVDCDSAKTVPPGDSVEIPSGPFLCGCSSLDQQCHEDEFPGQVVWLEAFRIDRTEVTLGQYAACLCAGACVAPYVQDGNQHCRLCEGGGANLPVDCVTWDDAAKYCEWAGGRLCTEAEWQKAARGTCSLQESNGDCQASRLYPWGNAVPTCELAVMNEPGLGPGCGTGGTVAVASKKEGASPYGVLDMAGNIDEFVSDICVKLLACSGDRAGGVDVAEGSLGTDAVGSCEVRGDGIGDDEYPVVMGGSFKDAGSDLKISNRVTTYGDEGSESIGFRCCSSVEP